MKKKDASTLIEVIVALVIVMIVLMIVVQTVTNIRKNNLVTKVEAFHLIKDEYLKVRQEKLFFSEVKKHSDYKVKRTIHDSDFGNQLKVVEIKILDNNDKVIIEKSMIVVVN